MFGFRDFWVFEPILDIYTQKFWGFRFGFGYIYSTQNPNPILKPKTHTQNPKILGFFLKENKK
jgi:hypothetical protein